MNPSVLLFTIYLCHKKCFGEFVDSNLLKDSVQALLSEDRLLNFTGLSKKYLRPAEEYNVTTEDGYILKVFHIPGNQSNVVLFNHGLAQSTDDGLLRGKNSLLYMLSDKGFDVWAMNSRGNWYSRMHERLNPDTDPEFWEYSIHEIGIYDYKAVTDFVLKKTGEKRLSIVGHSEGTTTFFIFTSELPEYNKKVKVFVGLAPVASGKHITMSFVWYVISKILLVFDVPLQILQVNEILSYYSFFSMFINYVCLQGLVGYEVCAVGFEALSGFNPLNIEMDFFPTAFGHFPTGTSRKNAVHYALNVDHKRFAQYDYGVKNFEIYGSLVPPSYNLKKITTKVALFAGQGDRIAVVADVVQLRKQLPNVVYYKLVDDKKFNHADFVWGRNAHVVLYPFVVDVLNKYNL